MAQSQEKSWKEVVEGNWKEIGRVRILGETRREPEGDIEKEYKKGIAVGSLRKES